MRRTMSSIAVLAVLLWRVSPLCGGTVSESLGPPSLGHVTHAGKLTIAPGADGTVVAADLSSIPRGAKVFHASLIAIRQPKGLEDRQDDWLLPVVVYASPDASTPLVFEAPWYRSFDVTEAVRKAVAEDARTAKFLVKQFYRWIPQSTELRVTWEGVASDLPPQVTGARAFHRSGNTFITWNEVEKLTDKAELTIGELAAVRKELAEKEKTRRVRYRVLRHTQPITAANVGEAQMLADVEPLSCANCDGGLDHWNRKSEAQNRFVVEDGKGKLPWGTGLYVHTTTEQEGTFHYAVVTVINGRANLKDISPANAPTEPVSEKASPIPIPVLQLDTVADKNEFGGVRNGARVRLYVTWNAEPFTNVPNMAYDWCVTVDEKQLANPAPVGLYLHEWGGTHVRTTWAWPGGRTGILVSGNDFPPQTWWYGWHEAKGTSRSWGTGKVHNYTERRVLAFLDWVATQWPVDRNRVFAQGGSMGGSGIYTFALRNGDRFAMVRGNVGIANWTIRGHFTTALELCTGYLNWTTIPASDAPNVAARMNMAQWLRENPTVETPFLAAGNGKDDGAIGWEQALTFFRALQETRRPHAVFWGLHGHGTPPPDLRTDDKRTQKFRLDQSLPAFAGCSLDNDLGTGRKLEKPREVKNRHGELRKDSFDGDPEGGLNLYLRWETDDLVDEPDRWAITAFLTAGRNGAPKDECTVDITPRCCREFKPRPGDHFRWTNTSVADGKGVQSGRITADKWGLVTVPKVLVTKGRNRIALARD
ncbi:MAG TPA: prolyl oligopeptidase family serine peptidase [Planctomycetota bacterium]|nr:prolyl oligopeptidase family serine peptidase [Planctomycetota bacterium]